MGSPCPGGALREAPAECEEVLGWTRDLCLCGAPGLVCAMGSALKAQHLSRYPPHGAATVTHASQCVLMRAALSV